MDNNTNETNTNEINTNETNTNETTKKRIKFDINSIISGVFSALIATIILSIVAFFLEITSIPSNIDDINEKLEVIDTSIASLDGRLDEAEEMISYFKGRFDAQTPIDEHKNNIDRFILLPNFEIGIETIENESYLSNPQWIDTDEITKNHNASEFYNQPIILSYEDNGKNVYFYGSYNENNNWNGSCILNIYDNNNLEIIFEGYYDNGTLLSYKRISCENEGMWTVTDRIKSDEYNIGETFVYQKTEDISENILSEKIILTFDDFVEMNNENILSYYHGNTSNGLYNDDTGNAYYIKYFNSDVFNCDHPVIQTLYQGNFVNGKFDDDTYNAWYITREPNTHYMYYRGCYSNGEVEHTDTNIDDFKFLDTYEQIQEKLNNNGFSDYLNSFYIDY